MKREVQIYHHLGLGDHIICNGLVREFCKSYATVYCFVKQHNMDSISFMYRDEPKIELVGVEDDWEVPLRVRPDIAFIKVGFENLDASNVNFDESFYKQLDLDFQLRWGNFFVKRDYQKESELLQKVNPDNVAFVFVHDDPSRGLCLDSSILPKDLKIIRASDYVSKGKHAQSFRNYTIFHWISVLRKAEEIHCMDSSFKCLVESLSDFENPKLFFHRYVRGEGPHQVCSTRKNWTVIERPSLHFLAHRLIDRAHRKFANTLTRNKPRQSSASPQTKGT